MSQYRQPYTIAMTRAAIIVALGALQLITLKTHNYTQDGNYYQMPRFWTSIGLDVAGNGDDDVKGPSKLLSDAMLINLRIIAALPEAAVSHTRIHWLLELIEFEAFTQAGVPIYDFTKLDDFIMHLDDLHLSPIIELMANPGKIFNKNPNRNDFYWQDLSYQLAKRYLNMLGASKLLCWRFESWNEPDVESNNRLNFTVEDYLIYLGALRSGLTAAGSRKPMSLHFPLLGPAGLFKTSPENSLCWRALEYCNDDLPNCPFDVLSYNRQGNGTAAAAEVVQASRELLSDIFEKFPKLKQLPLANDAADPTSDWSMPRPQQAGVAYAHAMIAIVLQHWQAMLEQKEIFERFSFLTHDNGYLSYHPYEFSQRTLLAHFSMNQTQPAHSQFIQKPVYAALGLLAKLAPLAADLETVQTESGDVFILKATVADREPLYVSWLFLPQENSTTTTTATNTTQFSFVFEKRLPFDLCAEESYNTIVEVLEHEKTDPAWVWQIYGQPQYPNATVRQAMRSRQTPMLHSLSQQTSPHVRFSTDLKFPWIALLRVCSNLQAPPKEPQQLLATQITRGEVLLTWREGMGQSTPKCLKTYEVWYKASSGEGQWMLISKNWHLPYPNFQFAPGDLVADGFYKVRALDIFERHGPYSEVYQYIELFI